MNTLLFIIQLFLVIYYIYRVFRQTQYRDKISFQTILILGTLAKIFVEYQRHSYSYTGYDCVLNMLQCCKIYNYLNNFQNNTIKLNVFS